MKQLFFVFALSFALSSAHAQTTPTLGIREKTPELRAFTGATIIVSADTTITNGILVIDDGRILDVGQDIVIPAGATVIDLTGMVILPGFIDVYSDYGVPPIGNTRRQSRTPKYTADREGGSAWNEAIHAQEEWVSRFEPDSTSAEKLIEQGITVVQTACLDGVLQGQSFVTLLGSGLPNDLILLPNVMAFGSFDKGSSQQEYPSSLMGSIAMIRQAFLDADWYQKAHAAYLMNDQQDRPEYNSALEALNKVTRKKQQMLFAPGDRLSLLRAEKIGEEFGLKFVELGSGHEYELGDEISTLDGRLILPVDFPAVPKVDKADQEIDYSLSDLRHWERAPSNPMEVNQAGVRFAFTSHGLERKSEFLRQVRAAVRRGLTSSTALQALTTLPAKMLGLSDQIGTIEEGKLANFIVADGNPLEQKCVIYSTWIAGQEHELADTDSRRFVGHFGSNWPDSSGELSVTADGTRLAGSYTLAGSSHKLRDVKAEYPSLYFGISLDSLPSPGVYRFAVRISGDTLAGFVDQPDATRMPWTAIRVARDTNSVDQEDSANGSSAEDAWVDEPMISKTTLPNKAWGFASPPAQESVLIQNATVWTAEDDGILDDCDVLVSDGKFVTIGKDLTAPAGARVVDASGKHITPGLIDEHSHLAISDDVNEGTHAITSEVRIGDVIDPNDVNIYRQLAGGVTSAQLLHGSANPIGGKSAVVKLRWGLSAEAMKFREAGNFIKFALGENVKQSGWGDQYSIRYPQTRMGVEAIIRDEFVAAREYAQAWDAYKKLGNKEKARTIPPRRDLRLEAISEVLRGDVSIVCHSYVQSEILMLMRLAEEFGIRVWSFIHVLEGYKVADELAAHGATATAFSDWWAYKFEVYDAIPYAAAIMFRHGVNTTVNSDNADLARRLNTEAAKAIEYGGLTPEEAIKLVTINSAIQLKAEHRIGSIRAGKDADFVIWNEDPLSIYASPDQTWIDGRLYFDRLRDLAMRNDQREEEAALVQKALQVGQDSKSGRKGRGRWEPESSIESGIQNLDSDGGAQ